MLNTIAFLTAMSATSGLMGHGKHCGGGRMHHARVMTVGRATPMMTCGSSLSYATTAPAPMPPAAPMASPQAPMMTTPTAAPAPVYPSPSGMVPPAPAVPPAPTAPTAPAPPAPPGS